jgi:hypothetical protein
MLKVTGPNNKVHLRWAIRANRKFTGHEDEETNDSSLYTIWGPRAQHAVTFFRFTWTCPPFALVLIDFFCLVFQIVTVKENGMAFHLSARQIEIDERKVTLVFLGSKKVHMACEWNDDAGEFKKKITTLVASNLNRYKFVSGMVDSVLNHKIINVDLVKFLATNRLVLCCEYIEPVGGGPINNALVHNISQPIPMAFSLVFNVLKNVLGAELCLDPV